MNLPSLNIRISGKGYPVIFLHGFLESNRMWEYLSIPNIQRIEIELPGHGSSPEILDVSIEVIAKHILSHSEIKNLETFHVVGHSMGGYVALEIKKQHPRCKKVILLNSNFWEDSPQKKKDRLRVAKIVHFNKLHFIREVIPNLFSHSEKFEKDIKKLIKEASLISSNTIASASIAMSRRQNNRILLEEKAQDFYIIQGDLDKTVPLEMMEKSLEEIPVHYSVISDCGHMAHIEKTGEVNEILNGILKSSRQ